MSETEFLQADPKYRELSKAVQTWATEGTPEEQKSLAYYFEYALREKLDLELAPDTTIEKGIQDTLTYSRLEEIRLTAINFVDRLFGIVNSTIDKTFAKAEAEAMKRLEDKLQELEEHGLDDMIEKKLAKKPIETEQAILKSFGYDPEVHLSEL